MPRPTRKAAATAISKAKSTSRATIKPSNKTKGKPKAKAATTKTTGKGKPSRKTMAAAVSKKATTKSTDGSDASTEPESGSDESEGLTPAERTVPKAKPAARKTSSAAARRRGRTPVSLQSTARTIDFGSGRLSMMQDSMSDSGTDVNGGGGKCPTAKKAAKSASNKTATMASTMMSGPDEEEAPNPSSQSYSSDTGRSKSHGTS